MASVAPPEEPGWYADASGAWWWWDGATWSPAPPPPGASTPDKERTSSLLMWVLYLVLGGWIVALVFYLISKDKRFVRHHAAEALNLTLVLLVPQVVGAILLVPPYLDWVSAIIDDPEASFEVTGGFVAGIVVLVVASLLNNGFGILGAVRAHRGSWDRLPIGVHPVRGALKTGEARPYDVGG